MEVVDSVDVLCGNDNDARSVPANTHTSLRTTCTYHSLTHYYSPLQNAEQELLEKYELCEVLGVGSTSTCHKCICRATFLPYACKIIDKQHIDDKFQGMMEQFHVEIEALRKLNHPSIIRLYDVYICPEKIYIVMELMEGGELFDYVVQKGTLTEEEASRIVKSVTSAMVYMHSKNVRT